MPQPEHSWQWFVAPAMAIMLGATTTACARKATHTTEIVVATVDNTAANPVCTGIQVERIDRYNFKILPVFARSESLRNPQDVQTKRIIVAKGEPVLSYPSERSGDQNVASQSLIEDDGDGLPQTGVGYEFDERTSTHSMVQIEVLNGKDKVDCPEADLGQAILVAFQNNQWND